MITNEMKAKIYAMYLGCQVRYADCTWDLRGIDTNEILDTVTISNPNDGEDWTVTNDLDNIQLILTPLSEITDEDAIEVAKMHYEGREEMINNSPQRYIKNVKEHVLQPIGLLPYYFTDFLRSKSYALPYMGIDLFASGIAIPNNKNQ